MVQSPSWEANWFAASQETPRISRNPKVHYRTHKRPPPVSILGQPNPVHRPISHLLEIHPNIIHPSTSRSPQWSLSLRYYSKINAYHVNKLKLLYSISVMTGKFINVKISFASHNFALVRRFRKNCEKVLFVTFVLPCVRVEQLCFHWTDFHEIWYLAIFSNLCHQKK